MLARVQVCIGEFDGERAADWLSTIRLRLLAQPRCALEDCPEGLADLRGVPLREHECPVRAGPC